jgi:hypothetical protein
MAKVAVAATIDAMNSLRRLMIPLLSPIDQFRDSEPTGGQSPQNRRRRQENIEFPTGRLARDPEAPRQVVAPRRWRSAGRGRLATKAGLAGAAADADDHLAFLVGGGVADEPADDELTQLVAAAMPLCAERRACRRCSTPFRD